MLPCLPDLMDLKDRRKEVAQELAIELVPCTCLQLIKFWYRQRGRADKPAQTFRKLHKRAGSL